MSDTTGVVVTLEKVYDLVLDMSTTVNGMADLKGDLKTAENKIGKLETQVAAQSVVIGIVIVVIASYVSRSL